MNNFFKIFKRIIYNYSIDFEYPKKVDVMLLDYNYANLKFAHPISYKVKKKKFYKFNNIVINYF